MNSYELNGPSPHESSTDEIVFSRGESTLAPHTQPAGETWTKQDDIRLLEAYKKVGPDWMRIATFLSGRSPHEAELRWKTKFDGRNAQEELSRLRAECETFPAEKAEQLKANIGQKTLQAADSKSDESGRNSKFASSAQLRNETSESQGSTVVPRLVIAKEVSVDEALEANSNDMPVAIGLVSDSGNAGENEESRKRKVESHPEKSSKPQSAADGEEVAYKPKERELSKAWKRRWVARRNVTGYVYFIRKWIREDHFVLAREEMNKSEEEHAKSQRADETSEFRAEQPDGASSMPGHDIEIGRIHAQSGNYRAVDVVTITHGAGREDAELVKQHSADGQAEREAEREGALNKANVEPLPELYKSDAPITEVPEAQNTAVSQPVDQRSIKVGESATMATSAKREGADIPAVEVRESPKVGEPRKDRHVDHTEGPNALETGDKAGAETSTVGNSQTVAFGETDSIPVALGSQSSSGNSGIDSVSPMDTVP